MIDYHRAFKIACELLNGATLYGVDTDKIFEIMMDKDGVVTNDSYEEYILNHLQELDHGQYAIKAFETEDAISRQAVLEITAETGALETQARVKALPSVTPKPKTWIYHTIGFRKCPWCGSLWSDGITENIFCNYCPRCGERVKRASE